MEYGVFGLGVSVIGAQLQRVGGCPGHIGFDALGARLADIDRRESGRRTGFDQIGDVIVEPGDAAGEIRAQRLVQTEIIAGAGFRLEIGIVAEGTEQVLQRGRLEAGADGGFQPRAGGLDLVDRGKPPGEFAAEAAVVVIADAGAVVEIAQG